MNLRKHDVKIELCLIGKALTFRHADAHHLDVALVHQDLQVPSAKDHKGFLHLRRVIARHAQPTQEETPHQFNYGEEQLFLVFEVGVKRPLRGCGARRDDIHGRPFKAQFKKHVL